MAVQVVPKVAIGQFQHVGNYSLSTKVSFCVSRVNKNFRVIKKHKTLAYWNLKCDILIYRLLSLL